MKNVLHIPIRREIDLKTGAIISETWGYVDADEIARPLFEIAERRMQARAKAAREAESRPGACTSQAAF